MYDYMLSLQEQFSKTSVCEAHRQEISKTHRDLVQRLNRPDRRKLLMLIDLEEAERDDVALANFMAGFRLALGIVRELSEAAPNSFLHEEDRCAPEAVEQRRDY